MCATCLIYSFTVSQSLQDTLRNPTVMNFMDDSLADTNLTTKDILNFLYSGLEEWRAPGMPRFDWRNIFNVVDQLIRTVNQYGEVRDAWQSGLEVEEETSSLASVIPLISLVGSPKAANLEDEALRLFVGSCVGSPGSRQVHQSSWSAPRRLQPGPLETEKAT